MFHLLVQTADTTPWWGAAVLVGVFSVSGVAIAHRLTSGLEQRKFIREATHRRDKEVREACTRFSSTLEANFNKMISTKPNSDWDWKVKTEVVTALTELELLAPEDILRAAHAYYSAYMGMQVNFDPTIHTDADYIRLVRIFRDAQFNYINVVRSKYDLAPLLKFADLINEQEGQT